MAQWIQKAIKRPGALSAKAKRIKGGYKNGRITPKGLAALAKSKNPTTRRQAALARTLAKLRKKK